MAGILYLCATPIGNLEDMTPRAQRMLAEADIIAAEDTRHTLQLLNRFNIKGRLVRYDEHSTDTRSGRSFHHHSTRQAVLPVPAALPE